MTPYEELEDAAAQLLDASHTEERKRYSGTPAWTRFAEEGYFARLANAVRRVRGERDGDPQSAIEAAMLTGDTECPGEKQRGDQQRLNLTEAFRARSVVDFVGFIERERWNSFPVSLGELKALARRYLEKPWGHVKA